MMRILAISVALATLTVAGCGKQPQQGTANDARPGAAQTPAPITAGSAPTTAQRGTPVMVSSTPAAPKPAPATNSSDAATIEAEVHLALPHEDETVALQEPARTALESAAGTAGNGPQLLSDDATGAVVNSLDSEFRNSCNAVVADWVAKESGSGRWTAQILFSSRGSEGIKVVLAIRCSTTVAVDQDPYDERLAIASITPQAAMLKLIPLSSRGNGDETLYHLNLSQAFRASGADLVELDAYHTTDNPCCGGGDEESGNRKVILDLATGKIALSGEERTELDRNDSDENADNHVVCEAQFSYSRDGAGNVESIATETRCTSNQKPPDVKKQIFTWNADAHQFVAVK